MTETIDQEYLTVRDASRFLGVSSETVYRLIRSGTLAGFRLGGGRTLLVRRGDVSGLLRPEPPRQHLAGDVR